MRSLRIWVLPLAALLLSACQGSATTTVAIGSGGTASPSTVMTPPSPGPAISQLPTARPTRQKATVRQMQRTLTAAGYPVGGIDGRSGPRTEQGLCAYRAVAGLPGGRKAATAIERLKILSAAHLPLPARQTKLPAKARSMVRGVVVDQECQVGFLVLGGQVVKIVPVSTGGHYQFLDKYNGQYEWADTARGLFHLTWRQAGKVTSNEVQGVMYYPWFFHGGTAVHGEVDPSAVPPYPVSHGCVRMEMPNILYIWKHYKPKDPVLVYGTY